MFVSKSKYLELEKQLAELVKEKNHLERENQQYSQDIAAIQTQTIQEAELNINNQVWPNLLACIQQISSIRTSVAQSYEQISQDSDSISHLNETIETGQHSISDIAGGMEQITDKMKNMSQERIKRNVQ